MDNSLERQKLQQHIQQETITENRPLSILKIESAV